MIVLFSSILFSPSNYNAESFKVTSGDLEATTKDKDALATAQVIYENGNSFVDKNNYGLQTEVKRKLKTPLLPADYDPYLKAFMNTMVDVQKNSIIVLNRKI
ncbi:hypothetical protein [Aestuariivivens sediminis]|uniref:hypothetical protein n=1 Tax=Aestuariivivens sediminis TaxID=2913557 RepID=UPI001F594C62|nr:hypothetical protein [Aestuariivivens sediminis]